MTRHLLSLLILLTAWAPGASWAQSGQGKIIPQDLAARCGLIRAWFTQAEMDPGRSRLKHLVLYDGILYAQTDGAVVHAIDAETGATLWAKQIGRPEHPSMTPGVGRGILAVVNGSKLYMANRLTGDILLETDIDAAPGAGPAVSDQWVYVPTVKGLLLAYRIKQRDQALKKTDEESLLLSEESGKDKKDKKDDKEKKDKSEDHGAFRLSQQKTKPLSCLSKGRTMVQPLITRETAAEEYVVWPTDEGCMYIGRVNRVEDSRIEVLYRLETAAPIIAEPAYLPPDPEIPGDSGLILAASGDGNVYAVLERNGEQLWRFSAGDPLAQPAAVIDERVYAATSLGGLYAIDVKTGDRIWHVPNIVQFIAAGKNRVYAADLPGSIRILDAATGAQIGAMPAASLGIKMLNDDTDRIYLADEKGLIQCLHEIGLTKPIRHCEARKRAAEEAAKFSPVDKKAEKTGEEKPVPKKESAAEKTTAEPPPAEAEQPADNAKSDGADKKTAPKSDKAKDPFEE